MHLNFISSHTNSLKNVKRPDSSGLQASSISSLHFGGAPSTRPELEDIKGFQSEIRQLASEGSTSKVETDQILGIIDALVSKHQQEYAEQPSYLYSGTEKLDHGNPWVYQHALFYKRDLLPPLAELLQKQGNTFAKTAFTLALAHMRVLEDEILTAMANPKAFPNRTAYETVFPLLPDTSDQSEAAIQFRSVMTRFLMENIHGASHSIYTPPGKAKLPYFKLQPEYQFLTRGLIRALQPLIEANNPIATKQLPQLQAKKHELENQLLALMADPQNYENQLYYELLKPVIPAEADTSSEALQLRTALFQALDEKKFGITTDLLSKKPTPYNLKGLQLRFLKQGASKQLSPLVESKNSLGSKALTHVEAAIGRLTRELLAESANPENYTDISTFAKIQALLPDAANETAEADAVRTLLLNALQESESKRAFSTPDNTPEGKSPYVSQKMNLESYKILRFAVIRPLQALAEQGNGVAAAIVQKAASTQSVTGMLLADLPTDYPFSGLRTLLQTATKLAEQAPWNTDGATVDKVLYPIAYAAVADRRLWHSEDIDRDIYKHSYGTEKHVLNTAQSIPVAREWRVLTRNVQANLHIAAKEGNAFAQKLLEALPPLENQLLHAQLDELTALYLKTLRNTEDSGNDSGAWELEHLIQESKNHVIDGPFLQKITALMSQINRTSVKGYYDEQIVDEIVTTLAHQVKKGNETAKSLFVQFLPECLGAISQTPLPDLADEKAISRWHHQLAREENLFNKLVKVLDELGTFPEKPAMLSKLADLQVQNFRKQIQLGTQRVTEAAKTKAPGTREMNHACESLHCGATAINHLIKTGNTPALLSLVDPLFEALASMAQLPVPRERWQNDQEYVLESLVVALGNLADFAEPHLPELSEKIQAQSPLLDRALDRVTNMGHTNQIQTHATSANEKLKALKVPALVRLQYLLQKPAVVPQLAEILKTLPTAQKKIEMAWLLQRCARDGAKEMKDQAKPAFEALQPVLDEALENMWKEYEHVIQIPCAPQYQDGNILLNTGQFGKSETLQNHLAAVCTEESMAPENKRQAFVALATMNATALMDAIRPVFLDSGEPFLVLEAAYQDVYNYKKTLPEYGKYARQKEHNQQGKAYATERYGTRINQILDKLVEYEIFESGRLNDYSLGYRIETVADDASRHAAILRAIRKARPDQVKNVEHAIYDLQRDESEGIPGSAEAKAEAESILKALKTKPAEPVHASPAAGTPLLKPEPESIPVETAPKPANILLVLARAIPEPILQLIQLFANIFS